MVSVRRILLSPTWWGRHLLMVVLVVAFGFLGRWQWGRAMSSTGSLQNLLYALEWWVFAGLVVLGWAHLVRDEVRAAAGLPVRPPEGTQAPSLPSFATGQHGRQQGRPAAGRGRRPASAADAEADVAADAELAAYNEYLAWLHEHPRR